MVKLFFMKQSYAIFQGIVQRVRFETTHNGITLKMKVHSCTIEEVSINLAESPILDFTIYTDNPVLKLRMRNMLIGDEATVYISKKYGCGDLIVENIESKYQNHTDYKHFIKEILQQREQD